MTDTYDFGDGPVPAHRHFNGFGWVASTAKVDATAYVGLSARVYGNACVLDNAQIAGRALVYGNAQISDNAQVYGDAQVCGDAKISGHAHVYGEAFASDNSVISGWERVYERDLVFYRPEPVTQRQEAVPTTDIVEMMRAAGRDDRLADGALYIKAADEIERLRKERVVSDYDMSIHQNPDAMVWAEFFVETTKDMDREKFRDAGYMVGWFANAMMAMHDHLTGTKITVLPDGSAFVVDKIRGSNLR